MSFKLTYEEETQAKNILRANNINLKEIDLRSFIEKRVNTDKLKNFDPNVGVESCQFIGLPGSGKTSFSMLLTKDLAKERGENILLGGDRFCEFRHYFRYPRIFEKIYFFYPDNHDLFYFNIPNKGNEPDDRIISERYKLQFESKQVNLDKFDIRQYLTNDTKATVFVIYDNHYKGKDIWRRAELWKRLTNQLLDRTILIDDQAITTLFNEAGTIWKEGASGKHYEQVDEFAEISVENRKGLVRRFNNSQIETEVYHPIRKKDLWKVYKLGTTPRMVNPTVRKVAPFQSRSAYILTYGGMFRIGNQTIRLSELKEKWKIIPQGTLQINETEEDSETIRNGYPLKIKAYFVKRNIYNGDSIRSLSRESGINHLTLANWIKNEELLAYAEKLL